MRKLTTFAQRRTSIQVYSSAAERSKSKIETGEHISNVLARFCAGPWLPVSAWAVGRPVFRPPLPGRFCAECRLRRQITSFARSRGTSARSVVTTDDCLSVGISGTSFRHCREHTGLDRLQFADQQL